MKLLPRQFRTEHYRHISTKPIEQIRADFNKLFTDRFLELGIGGKYTNESEFSLHTIAPLIHLKTPGPVIRGKITTTKDNQTVFNISVIPLPGLLFFYSFMLLGFLGLCGLIFNLEAITAGSIIVCLIFAFIIPAAFAFYAQVSKDNMRQKFEKHFGLKDGMRQNAAPGA